MRFFNNRGYYFVYDKENLTSVIHPVKRFIGKNMSKFKDKKIKYLLTYMMILLKNMVRGLLISIL